MARLPANHDDLDLTVSGEAFFEVILHLIASHQWRAIFSFACSAWAYFRITMSGSRFPECELTHWLMRMPVVPTALPESARSRLRR
jgi:hypothetical protein